VADIKCADEDVVKLALKQGNMVVKGRKLRLQKMDPEEEKVVIEGEIEAVMYSPKKSKGGRSKEKKSFFRRLFG